VGVSQINTTLGKAGGNNEANLLASIPGASFDSSGYPVLRGGREYEEGFQYEGIDYTDAFTHQFVNSLILNGAQNFQVQPGAGDASVGNAGTGAINVVAKRGTNPHFGQLEGNLLAGRYGHEARGEFGWASPNGRYSNYASLDFVRDAFRYGGPGADPLLIGQFFNGTSSQKYQDVLNNFVYKFGKDNNQSFQFFYDNTSLYAHLGYGLPPQGLPFKDNDPFTLNQLTQIFGLGVGSLQSVYPFTLGQTTLTQRYGGQVTERQNFNYNQPNETFKLQYSTNLNATTFLTAKFFRVNATALFDIPNAGNGTLFTEQVSLQGGQRTGIALDGTKQIGSKNLLGFGGHYDFLRPIYSQPSATNAFFAFAGGANGFEVADFLPNDANCPSFSCGYLFNYMTPYSQGNALNIGSPTLQTCPATSTPGTNTCGALPAALQLPYSDESTASLRQDFAFYIKDTYSPSDRLKIDLGLRLDGVNWKMPACDIFQCLPTSSTGTGASTIYQFNYDSDTRRPRVIQPRLAMSFQATKNDAFRFSYGRSVQFAPIATVDVAGSRDAYKAFANIPSYNNLALDAAGNPIPPGPQSVSRVCGVLGNQVCANYADQLYWENQNGVLGVPVQPLKPTTFNNYDFSYSHLFPHQLSVKVTPFYNKSYQQVASTSLPILKNGQPVLDAFGAPVLGPAVNTNLGKSSITGVEFLMTKEAAYGLSGSLSLTYQNEFSNVVPTSGSEDFFPSIPPASLQLGNLYRVGFLSPFVGNLSIQERTRTGWRINPVVFYNHGYPIGSGLLTATTVNGVNYNLPNTNVSNSPQLGASSGAPQYVDPRNPGSLFNPNVAATRGTPETASAGGVLSSARFAPVQLTLEYTSPRNPRSTFGGIVFNVFNNTIGRPSLNSRYAPVATGIGAPYSGYTRFATNPLYYGFRNFTEARGNQAYIMNPNLQPRRVQFYYQLSI
ncbi:MAG: TonB-dependent receptor, partial [Candidatus Eremiobacteraeota bacterium]|nr:TonB-dependent receptor [Candidatus Eremiobacteraeota bacterium]